MTHLTTPLVTQMAPQVFTQTATMMAPHTSPRRTPLATQKVALNHCHKCLSELLISTEEGAETPDP